MVLKVNDLTRAVDASLHTTHGASRTFLIVAQFCNRAIYEEDISAVPSISFSPLHLSTYSSLGHFFTMGRIWWRYQSWRVSLGVVEWTRDRSAELAESRLWWSGLWKEGTLEGARATAAGIVVA